MSRALKILVRNIHLEFPGPDGESPRVVFTDMQGKEWTMSHLPLEMHGGGAAVVIKKEDCPYFRGVEDETTH